MDVKKGMAAKSRGKATVSHAKRGPGRPPGKRSDPDFRQVSAWLPRSLYDRVSIRLIETGRKQFSELVAELLEEWLGKPAPAPYEESQ